MTDRQQAQRVGFAAARRLFFGMERADAERNFAHYWRRSAREGVQARAASVGRNARSLAGHTGPIDVDVVPQNPNPVNRVEAIDGNGLTGSQPTARPNRDDSTDDETAWRETSAP